MASLLLDQLFMTKGLRLVTLAALLCATAAEAGRPRVLPSPARGLFTGEQWRYRQADLISGLALRVVADLVAIPSGAPWWEASDWALLGAVAGSTVVLSAGRPSYDVQFQTFLQQRVLGADHFALWTTAGDIAVWAAAGLATVGLLIYGLVAGDAPAAETATLMIEAFAVAQLYHQMFKLLLGRAGPNRPELEGHYFGPARSLELWPSGTPSGHMASMYALLSVVMHYWDHPLLWVSLNAFALVFGAALVGDDYHWLSDVVFGAALGFCVGRWVVHHRSTRFTYGPRGEPLQLSVVPVVLPGTGAGVAMRLRF